MHSETYAASYLSGIRTSDRGSSEPQTSQITRITMSLLTLRLLLLAGLLCIGGVCPPASANPQLAAIPGARVNMDILQPFSLQSKAFPYPHQVTVALPASYAAQPKRAYPVLWVPDAPLVMRAIVGLLDVMVLGNLAPEMIVVGVGSPAEEGFAVSADV